MKIHLTEGGEGSGNFGHSGRPGQVGGSVPSQRFSSMDDWYNSLSEDEKNALTSWMRINFEGLRKDDREGNPNPTLNSLYKAIQTSPLYTSEVYRGTRMELDLQVGQEINFGGITSFSTNIAVAKSFAIENPETKKLLNQDREVSVFKIQKHKGFPKLPFQSVGGTYESEVVCEKGRKFKVVSIERISIKRPKKVWEAKLYVLEEI